MTLHIETCHLHPTPPFDFAQTLAFADVIAPIVGEPPPSEGRLVRVLKVGSQTLAVRIASAPGTREQPSLEATLLSAQRITPTTKVAAIDRTVFLLSVTDNLRPFYELAQEDEPFAPIVERLHGYHQLKFGSPFETACWAILAQQTPMAVARKQRQRLMERFGGSVRLPEGEVWAFPEPAGLAAADRDELALVVKAERKVEYLLVAAQAFARVTDQFLRRGPHDEVAGWLRSLPGIGEWSAGLVLVRGLGRMERALLDDERLTEAASRVYGDGRSLPASEIGRIAERYGPWQGYWAHYLRVAVE